MKKTKTNENMLLNNQANTKDNSRAERKLVRQFKAADCNQALLQNAACNLALLQKRLANR
jgi:hypothetical protein